MQSWIRSGGVAAALLVATVQTFACFGDNATDGEEGPVDGKPEIVEITAPAELDSGSEADLVVKLKGGANEQLSVAVDTSLGAFTPQSKVVITDEKGDATFTSRYASGAVAPLSLAAGTYWMAVSYMGMPMVRKSIEVGDTVSGWRIIGHLFTSGLPASLDAATASGLGRRNFYLVLRK